MIQVVSANPNPKHWTIINFQENEINTKDFLCKNVTHYNTTHSTVAKVQIFALRTKEVQVQIYRFLLNSDWLTFPKLNWVFKVRVHQGAHHLETNNIKNTKSLAEVNKGITKNNFGCDSEKDAHKALTS